jgi:hypothetical protein
VPEDRANQLVLALGREMVAVIAPEELPLFDPISQAYLADPERALAEEAGTEEDDALGFGVAEAQVMLTPVVLAVVTQVMTSVANETKATVSKEGASLVRTWLEWATGKLRPSVGKDAKPSSSAPAATAGAAPIVLTREQLAAVRQSALARALALKMPTAKAELLADSLVGRLAVGVS